MALAGAALAISTLAAQPAAAQESLAVRDFVLTHGIAQREPTDNIQSFAVQNNKVFAFARLNNTGVPTMVNFVWHYGGELHATVSLDVGTSAGWRTWSSARLRPCDWRVELVDADGMVLSEKPFTVGMAATDATGAMDYRNTSDSMETPETMFLPMR